VIYNPTFIPLQGSDPPLSITAMPTGQLDNPLPEQSVIIWNLFFIVLI
jgi:hypothetical protein